MNEAIEATARPLANIGQVVRVEDPPPALFSAMPPAQKLAFAREVATALREMLEQGKIVIDAKGNRKRKPLIVRVPQKNRDGVIVGYGEHVELEGWQTCGMLAGGITAVVRWTKDLPDGQGCDAFAEVVWQGQVIGSGEGHCDRNESAKWKKSAYYGIKSMAQTRAQSRAFRSVLSWIMVLAGFNPTPAAEVPPGGFDADLEPPEPPEPKSGRGATDPPNPPPAPPGSPGKGGSDEEARKKTLAAIHCLKADRQIDDAFYQQVLVDLFGDECYDAHGKPSAAMIADLRDLRKFWGHLNARTEPLPPEPAL